MHKSFHKFLDIFNTNFPLRKISRKRAKNKNWITKGILISIRYKNRLYRKYCDKPNSIRRAVYKNYSNKLVNILREGYATRERFLQRIRQNPPNVRKILWHDGVFNEIVIARHAQLNRHSR